MLFRFSIEKVDAPLHVVDKEIQSLDRAVNLAHCLLKRYPSILSVILHLHVNSDTCGFIIHVETYRREAV